MGDIAAIAATLIAELAAIMPWSRFGMVLTLSALVVIHSSDLSAPAGGEGFDTAAIDELTAGTTEAFETLKSLQDGLQSAETQFITETADSMRSKKTKIKNEAAAALRKAKERGTKKAKKTKLKVLKKLKKLKKRKAMQLAKKKKRAKQEVKPQIHLKNTGISKLKNVIAHGKQRLTSRILRAKSKVIRVRQREIQRMQRSEGGKAAIKAAHQLRRKARDKVLQYRIRQAQRNANFQDKLAKAKQADRIRRLRSKFRHLDRINQFKYQQRKEGYLQHVNVMEHLHRAQELKYKKKRAIYLRHAAMIRRDAHDLRRALRKRISSRHYLPHRLEEVEAPTKRHKRASKSKAVRKKLKVKFQKMMTLLALRNP